jgi:hypothetical protein
MTVYTSTELRHLTNTNKLVLRVTDVDSISALSDGGFLSSSASYDGDVDHAQWRFSHMGLFSRWDALVDSELDDIVRHITSGWTSRYGYYGDTSEWISTSAELEWPIWEIARRLTKCPVTWVDLSVIRRGHAAGYKGLRAVKIDAWDTLRLHAQKRGYRHDKLNAALTFSGAANEVLFYKRIFKKDVLETTTWTTSVGPACCPDQTKILIDRTQALAFPRTFSYHENTGMNATVESGLTNSCGNPGRTTTIPPGARSPRGGTRSVRRGGEKENLERRLQCVRCEMAE